MLLEPAGAAGRVHRHSCPHNPHKRRLVCQARPRRTGRDDDKGGGQGPGSGYLDGLDEGELRNLVPDPKNDELFDTADFKGVAASASAARPGPGRPPQPFYGGDDARRRRGRRPSSGLTGRDVLREDNLSKQDAPRANLRRLNPETKRGIFEQQITQARVEQELDRAIALHHEQKARHGGSIFLQAQVMGAYLEQIEAEDQALLDEGLLDEISFVPAVVRAQDRLEGVFGSVLEEYSERCGDPALAEAWAADEEHIARLDLRDPEALRGMTLAEERAAEGPGAVDLLERLMDGLAPGDTRERYFKDWGEDSGSLLGDSLLGPAGDDPALDAPQTATYDPDEGF